MIDISEHISEEERQLLIQLVEISERVGCEFYLIGASARDFFGYRYKLPQRRATEDTDIAVQVSSWEEFETFKDVLFKVGYIEVEKQPHRFISPGGRMLDVVPYGLIADKNQNIYWPPDQNAEMSVLGFEDAIKLAEPYLISQNPKIRIKVASLEGLICLKFIAWLDRPADLKQKDALDIGHLLQSVEKVLVTEVYDDPDLLAAYDYEVGQVASHLLGRNVKSSVSQEVWTKITELQTSTARYRDWEEFILDMHPRGRVSRDESEIFRQLLNAFFSGLSA